ncbi:hemopexin [Lepisosteus oculatus]|uniref:hemopexin n=1 Tax=Lepisosteus oculatus TaxID=7918 RepID=UPI0035F507FD
MRLLFQALCLCLALASSLAAPPPFYGGADGVFSDHHEDHHPGKPGVHQGAHHDGHHGPPHDDHHGPPHDDHHKHPDRCAGIEFDAITPDEKGNTFFFKGDHLWKGFTGKAQFLNESFHELDDHHHLDHIDAAFRMHDEEDPEDHDHIFFFLNDKVYSYYNHTLEAGFPKDIHDEFPGIPDDLDAAVECPKGECQTNSVLFFKGSHVYHHDLKTHAVKEKNWPHLGNCTAAFRWLERYYCFHGHSFTKFNPVTGEVKGDYPKDARNYFMRCPGFGHGKNDSKRDHIERCSKLPFDEFTSDDEGRSYAFRGAYFLRLDTARDGWHAWPIDSAWKEVHSDVDAVFSWDHKLYIIKDGKVYIYKTGQHYTLVEGYPKTLKEELGVEGEVDAAFVCAKEHVVHIIQGSKMLDVDLTATPRTVVKEWTLPYKHIDGAMCGADKVRVFVGPEYFEYESPRLLALGRIKPPPHKISVDLLKCED